jgi:plastocyanin
VPGQRLATVLALMLGALGCASATAPNRVIPVIPGFPLEANVVHVDAGDRLTWVNGDVSRGAFRLEFDRTPGMPEISSTSAGYTASFGTAGTYPYTISATTRTGVALMPRSGQVIVRDRGMAAPPPAPPAPAADQGPPGPKPADDLPLGVAISRVTGGADAYAAYHYRPDQGIVLKVEQSTAEPAALRPGAEINLRVTYTVLAPRDSQPVKVREIRTLRYGNQDLRRLEKDVTVSTGTYSSEHRLSVPSDAAEGSYTVTTLVEIPAVTQARGEVSSAFSVTRP